MSKLRVAVIGVGYLGRFHAQKYAKMEDADLTGAMLVRTDFTSAEIEAYQYKEARSIENITLPNGTTFNRPEETK